MAKKLNTRARINTKLIPQHWLSLDSHRKSLTILHNLFIRYTRCSVLLSFGVDWPSSPMRTSAGHFYRADGVSCIKTKIELLPMEKLNRRDLHSTSCRWFDSSILVFIFSLLKIKTTCSVWTSGFFFIRSLHIFYSCGTKINTLSVFWLSIFDTFTLYYPQFCWKIEKVIAYSHSFAFVSPPLTYRISYCAWCIGYLIIEMRLLFCHPLRR